MCRGQVDYQKGNAAGADPDLKAFALRTLPKTEDHLRRAATGSSSQHRRWSTNSTSSHRRELPKITPI
jgi:hypothetical protein